MNPMVYHSPFFVSLGGLLGKWRDNDNHRCCEICVAGYTAGHPRVASLALRAIHLLGSPRPTVYCNDYGLHMKIIW